MGYPNLRLYPTVEELKKMAGTLNALPNEQYKHLEAQGIPTVLIRYLKKR